MKTIGTLWLDGPDIEEGPDEIHIDGEGLTGFATLCGHCDRTDHEYRYCSKPPTCRGCLAVWDHVKKHRLPK